MNRAAPGLPGSLPRTVDTLPDTLDCDQVAELLGIHPQVARLMAREGRLPASQPGGQRAWQFNRDEVLAWLKAHPAVSDDPAR